MGFSIRTTGLAPTTAKIGLTDKRRMIWLTQNAALA